jgi:hypothetical protein
MTLPADAIHPGRIDGHAHAKARLLKIVTEG